MEELTAAQHLAIARDPARPNVSDYIQALFTDFFEQRGDRLCGEDPAILGGVALFHGHPVTVIGTRKGKTLEENLRCHFGMPSPEGYRKARRLMDQAEKFRRPIITLIDTSGAYPGLDHEPADRPGGCGDSGRGKQRRRFGSGRGGPGADAGAQRLCHFVSRGLRLYFVEGCRPQPGGGGLDEADGAGAAPTGRH